MLKKDGPTYIRLLNDFDVAFFEERLRHNAFDGNSMVSLVETTFAWIHNLQMPIRDSATFAAKARVMNAGTTMLEVVPVYIQECHKCLNTMENDIRGAHQYFRKTLSYKYSLFHDFSPRSHEFPWLQGLDFMTTGLDPCQKCVEMWPK